MSEDKNEIKNEHLGINCTIEELKECLKEYGYSITKVPSYEISKIGFLVGGKLMVFRRVSDLRFVGSNAEGLHKWEFSTQIKKYGEWKSIPVKVTGEKVFELGI